MIIYVDIDKTICTLEDITDYTTAKPIKKNIEKINRMYDNGNRIVYWTARGSGTGISWGDVTVSQLAEWGAKYHELIFNKPIYDLFIDDRAINSERFFNEN